MSLEQRAQILETAASTTCSVRDLVQSLNWKTSKVISLLKEMKNEKLIDVFKRLHYAGA